MAALIVTGPPTEAASFVCLPLPPVKYPLSQAGPFDLFVDGPRFSGIHLILETLRCLASRIRRWSGTCDRVPMSEGRAVVWVLFPRHLGILKPATPNFKIGH
jgi:hypothetical protein